MRLPIIEVERIKRGLTKDELAQMLGVKKRTIQNWQNGKTQIPSSKLLVMAREWDCSIDYLLGLSDEPKIKMKIC